MLMPSIEVDHPFVAAFDQRNDESVCGLWIDHDRVAGDVDRVRLMLEKQFDELPRIAHEKLAGGVAAGMATPRVNIAIVGDGIVSRHERSACRMPPAALE